MEFFWFVLTGAGIVGCLIINPALVLPAFSAAAEQAIKLSLQMWGVYAVWLGFLEILSSSGLMQKLFKPLKKIIRFLFGEVDQETENYLCQNIAGNVLGVGGVSTPSGIKACEKLQGNATTITAGACMLIILNSSSLQFMPTTIIGLRASNGSLAPADIFLPVFITSIITTLVAVFSVKLFFKIYNRKKRDE